MTFHSYLVKAHYDLVYLLRFRYLWFCFSQFRLFHILVWIMGLSFFLDQEHGILFFSSPCSSIGFIYCSLSIFKFFFFRQFRLNCIASWRRLCFPFFLLILVLHDYSFFSLQGSLLTGLFVALRLNCIISWRRLCASCFFFIIVCLRLRWPIIPIILHSLVIFYSLVLCIGWDFESDSVISDVVLILVELCRLFRHWPYRITWSRFDDDILFYLCKSVEHDELLSNYNTI